jgi:hypothetical protein
MIIEIKEKEVNKMLFFPIFIPFFTKTVGRGSGGSCVKSGDKYTTEWWQNDLDGCATKPKIAACLIRLERQGMVKKIKNTEFDVVRFKPIKPFSKAEIIEKLNEKIS